MGRPTAATIHSTARFYKPEWQYLWAEHDPEQAGRLLDEVGLTGRDRDGSRTLPAGSNLTIQIAARNGGPVDLRRHRRRHRVLELDQRRRRRPARRLNVTGSYAEWEEPRRLVERGERKLSAYGGELPGTEPPEEWKRYFDWQRQFRLSEFGSGEWFELAQKMFDFTGDNVFVLGTVGEAPNILLTNNDLRNVPTEFPVSNTDWKGNLMYWADQLWLDR